MRILFILIPGIVVGFLIMDSVRRIFSDDKELLKRIFADQPVTMIATAGTIGSVAVWAVLEALRLW